MSTVAAQSATHYIEFTDRLEACLAHTDSLVAVVMVEASNLSRIDARFGRKHRDQVLADLGEKIDGAIRDADYAAQIGDNMFAVIFPGLKNRGHATLAGKKLLRLYDQQTPEPTRDAAKVETRIGVALCPEHADDAGTLIRRAQVALEVAKESQQDLVIYDTDKVEQVAVTWEIRDDLAEAIRESELDVYFHPKLDLQTGAVFGAEALVRWFSEKRGTVPPDTFIPVAERSDLIQPLTRYILNTAMRNMMMWQRDGHDIGIAVNVPASMLIDAGIVGMVQSLMSVWDLQAGRLTLELTESAIMEDVEACFSTMSALKKLGCRISIDDFGTGYSSFAHFKNIPADELKIDRSFVKNLQIDIADQHIVETIIGLAHRFKMKVVAEGIEDEATMIRLKELGCDVGQGFHIAEPMSQDDYDAWLDAKRYAQPEL